MVNVNLVPVEIKEKITNARKTASAFGIAIVFIIFFIVSGILLRLTNATMLDPSLNDVKDQLAKSYAQLKEFDAYQQQALTINDRVRTAAQIDLKRARWSIIIRELINCVPQNVQFETFTADSSKTPNFVLTANTDSERNIILFKDKLEKSDYFKNVNFKSSSTEANTADKNGTTDTPAPSGAKKVLFSLEFDLEKLTNTTTPINPTAAPTIPANPIAPTPTTTPTPIIPTTTPTPTTTPEVEVQP